MVLSISSLGYTQNISDKKWYSNADLELITHKKVEYSFNYFDTDRNSRLSETINVSAKKPAFGLAYSFNYMVFKKWSIGLLTGYKSYKEPDLSMLELGGTIKYFFVNTNNIYTYISVTNAFSLNNNEFSGGGDTRIGIGVPIVRVDKLNININIFKEQNFLRLKGVEPLIGLSQESPGTLIYNSWGISAGVKF